MIKITQNFYQAKTPKLVSPWLRVFTLLMVTTMLLLGGIAKVNAQTQLVSLGYAGNGTNNTVSWLTSFTGGTAVYPSTTSSAFTCLSTVNFANLAMTSSVNATISLTTDEIYAVQVEAVNNGTGANATTKIFYEYSTNGTFAGGANIITLVTGLSGNATASCATTKFTTATAGAGVKYIKITANANCRIGRIIVYKKDGSTISTTGTLSSVNTTYGTPSASPTSFNVSGANMAAGISVNPPVGFQVSTASDFSSNVGTNGSPITVGAAGTIASTPVYVRLLATATVAGSPYSGNIVLSSSGATSVNVATVSSTVSTKGLTITGLTGSNKPYDGNATASFTGTAAYSGLANSESFSVTGTPSATFANATAANGKAITVSGYTAPTTNYTVTQPTGLTGNITKIALTITAGNQSVTYGTSDSVVTGAGTYTPTGFVNSETSSVISGSASYTTNYTNTTPAGTSGVHITPAIGSLAAANYDFSTFVDGTITINKANSSIAVTGSNSFSYDGNPHGPSTYNVTGSTGSVTFNYTNTSGPVYNSSTPPTNAGSYEVIATVDADTNYNGASSPAFAFDIVSATQPVIDSPLTASATYGVAVSTYTITATNTPTSFNAAGLPAGLSVNTSTGEITGTPTAAPGNYNVTISATNGSGTGDDILVYTIHAKSLTVSSAVANNKEYDRTNTATISGTLNGIVSSDDVTLNGTGTFAQATVGTAIVVSSTSSLSGAKASYYSLTQPTGLTADITAKALTVNSAVVTSKTYTGTDTATITGATLGGVITPDAVTLVNGGGTFADVNVANGISVTSAFSLTGTDSGNYTVTQPVLTGNITTASLTITGLTGSDKPYDGNNSATFTGTPAYSGLQNGEVFAVTGTPVATFGNATAANGKTITVNGYAAPTSNYSVTAPALTANITKVALTITANNQNVGYGTAVATVTAAGTFTATGFVNSETASVISGAATYTTSYTNSTAVGTSGVTITPAAGSLAATNYDFTTFVDGTVTVTLGTQTITLAATATKAAGFADYSPATSATSGINPITYTSSNPAVATVVNGGTQIHYIGLGSTTITASQAASANYNAASDATQTLTVAKAKILYATLTKTLSGTGASTVTDEAIIRMLSADPNFTVTVSSTDATGSTLPALSGFDMVVVQESFGGTNGILLPASGKLAIKNLTIPVIYNKAFALQNARAVTATSTVSDTSLLSVDITGNTTNPLYSGMDVSSNSIPLFKTTSDDNGSTSATGKGISYVNGLDLTTTGTLKASVTGITNADKAILINDIPAGTQFGTASTDVCPSRMIAFGFNFGAIAESNGKNVTNEFLTLWRNAVYILTGQTPPSTLYMNPDNDQTITFNALSAKNYGDASFALTATSAQTPNSGNAITYASSDTAVATVSGSTVTIVGVGTTNITASQAAGGSPAYWYAATPVVQALTINKGSQTITFGALASKTVGDAAFALGATASSGLTVTYTSSNPAVATVSGNTVTIVDAGTTTITASQAGNANYNAATDVLQVLTVSANTLPTTWTTSWSTGKPTSTKDAIIAGSYSTTTNGEFTAQKLTVNSGVLTVNSGTNITVQNEVVNNAAATALVIENNANLIQVNNATNTGAVTVKRNGNSLFRLDYTIWSSPVTGTQRLYDFSPMTSTNRFNVYNPNTDAYDVINNTVYFGKGKGYLIRMPNSDATVGYNAGTTAITHNGVFTGTPNNGTVTVTGLVAAKYNAIGNPYPSTIDADAFINNGETDGTLYFFRKTNGGSGSSYATYTLAGETFTDTSATPNGTIQVGQGFLVTPIATTLSFTNTMRVANNDNQFFKTKKTIEKNRIWLNLTDSAGAFSQTLVSYMTNATQGVDVGIDGKYINDSKIALTSNINNVEYTIQGRPLPFDPSDVVPLNFKTDKAGNYTIAIDHKDGFFAAGQDVYLVDSLTGTETDLKAGSYTFTAPAGTANSRFSLKYQKTLGVDTPAFNENSVTVYKTKGIVYVNSGNATIANVKVYDVQGKLLVELKKVESTTATISNLKDTNQVLIVKITAQDTSVVTKKVVN